MLLGISWILEQHFFFGDVLIDVRIQSKFLYLSLISQKNQIFAPGLALTQPERQMIRNSLAAGHSRDVL